MLNKTTFSVAFNQGVDTKTDPKQVKGKLLYLVNSYFQTLQKTKKRNGYIALPSLGSGVALNTYNNELVSLDGTNLFSYNETSSTNINKGACPTVTLSTQSVVRNTNQQTNQDSSQNGTLQCFVWTDSGGGCNYSVFDTFTGQSIVNNQVISATADYAKVLSIGVYFIIIYRDSSSHQLIYKYISTASPTVLNAGATITSDMNTSNVAWDATTINGAVFIAYNNSSAKISLYSLSNLLVLSSQVNFGSSNCNAITIFSDASFNVWVAYSVTGGAGTNTTVNVFVLNNAMGSTVLAKTQIDAFQISAVGPVINNLTGVVTSITGTVYYSVVQAATVSGLPLNFIKKNTVTTGGSVGSAGNFLLEADLASKAISFGSFYFFLVAYQSNLQSSYFLIRSDGNIAGKLAPSNGGGLATKHILPELNQTASGIYLTASLIKDSAIVQNGVITALTGVQSATFTFITKAPSKFVLGNNLHVCGSMVKMYDGGSVVEHGFNLYPEGLSSSISTGGGVGIGSSTASINQKQYVATYAWTDNQGQVHESAPSVPITASLNGPPLQGSGTFTNGSANITGVTNASQMSIGQYVLVPSVWSNFNTGLTITGISGTTVTLSTTFGPTTGVSQFLVSSNPFATWTGSVVAGSKTITIPNGDANDFSNVAVGQQILWGNASQTGLIPASSPFPAGSYITAFTAPVFGVSAGSITVSNVALYSLDLTALHAPNFYSLDTQKIIVTVPTLKLTNKSNVIINVYATTVNGTIFYLASSPLSPTANDKTTNTITFNDTVSDSTLIGNAQLYTTGGEVENLGTPALNFAFKYKTRSVGVLSESPLSFIFSKDVIPGTPVEFNNLELIENVDSAIGSITAGGQLDDKMILFGPKSKYYIAGDGPTSSGTQNDFTQATKIAGTTGCSNPASVVATAVGLMYQDPIKGIWLLDRSLQEQYIGMDVEAYNGYQVTSALVIDTLTQVRFTISNGTALVYDYVANQWSIFSNHSANDACNFQNEFTFINANGAIWQESPGTWTDGDASAILQGFTSAPIQMSDIQGFQRIYAMLFLGTYYSAHTITANIYLDFSPTPVQTTLFSIPNASPPQARLFMDFQKCEALQISIQENQSLPYGEGYDLSNVLLVVGQKKGPFKLPAAVSYG